MIPNAVRTIARPVLKTILPRRIYDIAATYANDPDHGVSRLKSVLKGRLLSYPISPLGAFLPFLYPDVLSIALTTRCNLRCFICRREDFRGENLEFENLRKLENAFRHASTVDVTGWGECLLYPRFEEVLRYIYSLNGSDNLIQITTNGTLLSGRVASLLGGHLKRLVVSLNAATAATYRRDMLHGDFDKTLANVRAFRDRLGEADRGKMIFHFVAHAENFREIPDFVRLARDVGVPTVNVGQYLVDIPEHRRFTLLNVKDDYNGIIDAAVSLGRELGVNVHARRFHSENPPSAQQCLDPVTSCFIEVDGKVGPCCFCGSYRIGNVYESGFEAVWFGKEYRRLRRKRYLPACRTCVPFVPLDDPGAHFTAGFKTRPEFREICEMYK